MPKGYNKRKGSKRPIRSKKQIKTFYLFCEGQNTEPNYFDSFNLNNVKCKSFGIGQQRKKLVETSIDYLKQNRIEVNEFDEVWVVFDFDIKEIELPLIKQQYGDAISLAEKNNIKCAFSNDCFELWFLLHFNYVTTALNRKDICSKLSQAIDDKYSKSKTFSLKIYDTILAKQKTAIKNAKKLEKYHSGKKHWEKNPYTSVYKLVEELNKYLR